MQVWANKYVSEISILYWISCWESAHDKRSREKRVKLSQWLMNRWRWLCWLLQSANSMKLLNKKTTFDIKERSEERRQPFLDSKSTLNLSQSVLLGSTIKWCRAVAHIISVRLAKMNYCFSKRPLPITRSNILNKIVSVSMPSVRTSVAPFPVVNSQEGFSLHAPHFRENNWYWRFSRSLCVYFLFLYLWNVAQMLWGLFYLPYLSVCSYKR